MIQTHISFISKHLRATQQPQVRPFDDLQMENCLPFRRFAVFIVFLFQMLPTAGARVMARVLWCLAAVAAGGLSILMTRKPWKRGKRRYTKHRVKPLRCEAE